MANLGAVGASGSLQLGSGAAAAGGASGIGSAMRVVLVGASQSLVTDAGVLAGLWAGAPAVDNGAVIGVTNASPAEITGTVGAA